MSFVEELEQHKKFIKSIGVALGCDHLDRPIDTQHINDVWTCNIENNDRNITLVDSCGYMYTYMTILNTKTNNNTMLRVGVIDEYTLFNVYCDDQNEYIVIVLKTENKNKEI